MLFHESSSSLFHLLSCSCYDVLVRSIVEFLTYLFLILRYMIYIYCNIIQASLGSLLFDLLWLRSETFIMPVLVFLYYFPYSLFKRAITLWEYLCVELFLTPLPILCLYTSWITRCSSFVNLIVSLGSLCAPSIYDVTTMYAFLSFRR